jgi:hypothetical protein
MATRPLTDNNLPRAPESHNLQLCRGFGGQELDAMPGSDGKLA